MDHIFIFLTKKFGLLPNSKTSTSKFFPRLYRIHLNTDQSFGWQPLLAGPSNKKRCHEIIQDQTRSAELIRYKPSIFPCCSNSSLFSLLCDTILHLVISPDPFFLLSSVCLKTNEEIFKHWTTLCSERNLIHWHIMTLYTRTDVTILCYNVTNVDVTHLNELQWSDHHAYQSYMQKAEIRCFSWN